MATSQNGYVVYTSSGPLAPFRWVTGRVKPGDVHTVLDYLCEQFNEKVERITVGHSWGWAYRPIRGSSTGYSNHASGTAIDLNAPAHPLGRVGTFSPKQVKVIHGILADLDGVIRWGGDYRNRKDEMHFEIDAGRTAVAAVAKKISGPPWRPDFNQPIDLPHVKEQFLIAAGIAPGEVKRTNGVALIQDALNDAVNVGLDVDGYVGPSTLDAWGRFEAPAVSGRPRIPDEKNLVRLSKRFKIKED